MRRTVIGLIAVATLLVGSMSAQQRKPQEVELQAAIRTETVDGDLTRAIAQYRVIVTRYSADRPTAAPRSSRGTPVPIENSGWCQ